MSHIRDKIKTCLQIITKSLKQIPEDKQPIFASRVSKVLEKYTKQQANETEEHLQSFSKELHFNLNFIKLSYPNIDFKLQQEKPPQPKEQLKTPFSEQFPKEKPFPTEPGKIFEQFELENAEAIKKQMKNISSVRQEVDFSNWSEGNLDPSNLKRHKQLLTRQHFAGDFWKGKKPEFQSAKVVAGMMQNAKPPTVTDKDLAQKKIQFPYDPEKAFERVKR